MMNRKGNLLMNFEMYKDALRWRKRHRQQLRSGNRAQRRVARHLNRCRKTLRCETEACRICLREFRLRWTGEVIKIVLQKRSWVACSIIPTGFLLPYSGLSTFDLETKLKGIRKRLERSGISNRVVVGGIDVSLNLSGNNMVGWQFHLYLLAEGENDNVLQEAVKSAFPPEPSAAKPYQFREVEDPLAVC
jgi:hypothetical protein